MCKISIIVPVYNVQRYLDKCLKSVLSQTFQDIEVVAIDDGSTDRSGEILDSYAKRDIRLHVIHRENRGYGKTINQGIALAKGKYIAIVESDDWIEPDMLACLWDKAEQYDAEIARCGFYIYDSHQDPQNQNIVWDETAYMMSYNPDGVFIPMDYPENFVFHSAIWTYLYRTDFIKKIPFLENLRAYCYASATLRHLPQRDFRTQNNSIMNYLNRSLFKT